ncbi:MAG: PorT family protein [Bacteroidales bacterium]|nr:PorT family protein [Bacteroidales bacterium]
MKKTLTTIACLFVMTGFAFSQVSFGPRVGLSSSKITIDETLDYNGETITYESDNAKLGFHAGLFLRIAISSFYIQPEALFTSSGGNILVSSDNYGEQVQELTYNKLDVPVMLGFKLGDFFRIQAGPKFSLLLNDDARDLELFPEIKQNYQDAILGYQAGIGFDIWKFYLDFKYEGDLSDFGKSITIGNTSFSTNMQNNLLMVMLGFNIF